MVQNEDLKHDCDYDLSKYVQIGKLNKEDMGKLRGHHAFLSEKAKEIDYYASKIKSINAELEMKTKEWWLHIRKTYGIPPHSNLHIQDDGRILMELKNK